MSDLHQQLWEFVYDLLPEDEAQAMRERISSDPDVARAYSEVKLQTEVITRVSRFDADRMVWKRPGEAASPEQAPTPAAQPVASSAWRLTASWLVGIAAAGLLCVMSAPLFVPDLDRQSPVADATADVSAPAESTVPVRAMKSEATRAQPAKAQVLVMRKEHDREAEQAADDRQATKVTIRSPHFPGIGEQASHRTSRFFKAIDQHVFHRLRLGPLTVRVGGDFRGQGRLDLALVAERDHL